jgi:phosphoribosylformylglycinamidine cyclo-ligase
LSIGEALLVPHRSYLDTIRPLLPSGAVKGMAHITGGGITDNLPRVLPSGTHAQVDRAAWRVPRLFTWLQQAGSVPDDDMLRTFNMGIGLILAVSAEDADWVLKDLRAAGESEAAVIGRIAEGGSGVRYC